MDRRLTGARRPRATARRERLGPEQEYLLAAELRTTAGQGYNLFPTHGNSMSPAPPNVRFMERKKKRRTNSSPTRAREAACVLVQNIAKKKKLLKLLTDRL